jgi:peptidylprolyl isomerase
MAQAKSGDKVKIHYEGRLDDGSVFDSSDGSEPLEFTIGASQVIPGFEEAVTGMSVGEKRTVTIPASKAYGQRNEALVKSIDRANFAPGIELKVGLMMRLTMDNNESIIVQITGLDDKNVTLDANHPLAGKDLTFDITLVEIYPEKS